MFEMKLMDKGCVCVGMMRQENVCLLCENVGDNENVDVQGTRML